MSIDKMRSYRLEKLEAVEPIWAAQPVQFEVRFRLALIALRLEINTRRDDGSCLMMTSRRKAPAPMTMLRSLGFKAKTKDIMLKKCTDWASEHGITLARS